MQSSRVISENTIVSVLSRSLLFRGRNAAWTTLSFSSGVTRKSTGREAIQCERRLLSGPGDITKIGANITHGLDGERLGRGKKSEQILFTCWIALSRSSGLGI